MRRLIIVALSVLATLAVQAPRADAASLTAATATGYRAALTQLSTDPAGPHTLTLTGNIDLSTGPAPVYTGTAPLTIDGAGFTIDGGGVNRAIDHQSTATLTLRDLTVRDASSGLTQDGGAVTVDGDLVIEDSTFDQNSAAGANGGAVEVQFGSLTVTDSVFTDNTAKNIGGAIEHHAGVLTISGSTFTGNTVTDGIGGGAVYAVVESGVSITDSTFTTNTSSEEGGAAYLGVDDDEGTVSITGGTFTANEAGRGGGALRALTPLEVDGVTFSQNQAGTVEGFSSGGAIDASQGGVVAGSTFTENTVTDGDGGAVFARSHSTPLHIETSTFTGNQAVQDVPSTGSDGGAVASSGTAGVVLDEVILDGNAALGEDARGGALFGTALVEDSVLRFNRVEGTDVTGGAVATGPGQTAEIRRSLMRENEVDAGSSSGAGGALGGGGTIVVEQSELVGNSVTADNGAGGVGLVDDLTIRNSNLIGNTASSRGGAVATDVSHHAVLEHVTALQNDAPSGDHLSVLGSDQATLSVVAFGPAATGTACAVPGGAAVSSTGGNVVADTSCGLAGEAEGTGLGLGPRRDNGGGRQTFFPLAGSPVVDQVSPCTTAVDLRGVPRPFGASCDAGAVEQVYPVDHAFTDVPNWVRDAIAWISSPVNDPALMVGITPTRFEPNDPITRAQVVRMLHRLAGSPDVSSLPAHPFTDVPPWVEDAVRWAHAEEIVTGITPTLFVPDDPITRAQVVRMLYRLAGSPDVTTTDPHPFTDVPAWVEDAVTWAADPDNPLPIVTGITPTRFVPNDDITRAQVARMTYRLGLTPTAWDTALPPTIPAAAP